MIRSSGFCFKQCNAQKENIMKTFEVPYHSVKGTLFLIGIHKAMVDKFGMIRWGNMIVLVHLHDKSKHLDTHKINIRNPWYHWRTPGR